VVSLLILPPTELRDSAREKGSKSFETFSKACRSLSACPVTYPRPRDLVVLQGIGPKIASVLETRYLKYCQENGLPLPGSPESESDPSCSRWGRYS
jgi:crossover junction endonuclease MUS81